MRRRSTLTCALATAGVFAVLLMMWRSVSASITPRAEHPSQLDSTTLWIGPGRLPLTVIGDLDAARTVVIGDSRTMNGVRRELLDDAGFGPSCVIWRGGADLLDIMGVIDTDQIELLVVALSPISVSPYENRIMQEVVRKPAPIFEPGQHTRAAIFGWMRDEKEHLLKNKFPAATIDPLLATLKRAYDDESAAFTKAGAIDRGLMRILRGTRTEVCEPLKTGIWQKSWFPVQNEKKSNNVYRRQLTTERYKEAFQASADAISSRMRELSQSLDLVTVRLPISRTLRRVEDLAVAPERVSEMASNAGVPFFDFGTSPHTSDGSHLNTVGSEEWTRELIETLKGR